MWRVLPLQRTVPAFWEAIVPIGLWGKDTLHMRTRISVPQALTAESLTNEQGQQVADTIKVQRAGGSMELLQAVKEYEGYLPCEISTWCLRLWMASTARALW